MPLQPLVVGNTKKSPVRIYSHIKGVMNKKVQRCILAGVTIIALDSLRVFVEPAIFIGTYWVEAQVVERGIDSRVTTPVM